MREIAEEAFRGLGLMYMLSVVMMIAVIVAMGLDLASGWRKAKLRGEERTSYGFSRSFSKFLIYEGIAIVGTCIDTMIHFVWAQFANGTYYFVPVVTAFLCTILCIVEAWSIREKADQKQRRRMNEAAGVVATILTDDSFKQAIIKAASDKLAETSQRTVLDKDDN